MLPMGPPSLAHFMSSSYLWNSWNPLENMCVKSQEVGTSVRRNILFQIGHFSAFLHNSYGSSEFPDCGNLVGADFMGNLRWANMEPAMHFRMTNTDLSMHFREANTDLSMHFRKVNTEFLLAALLPTLNFTSKCTPSFIPNIAINLLHHDECNIFSQVTVN